MVEIGLEEVKLDGVIYGICVYKSERIKKGWFILKRRWLEEINVL